MTADELAHAREPDSFRRLMGEREMDVRRVLIDNRGLSSVYERQATVRGWLHKYITGHLTWQGALLLAYRALAFEYVETCRYIPVQMPRLDARLITLETVAPAHVIDAAGLVHAAQGMAMQVLELAPPSRLKPPTSLSSDGTR